MLPGLTEQMPSQLSQQSDHSEHLFNKLTSSDAFILTEKCACLKGVHQFIFWYFVGILCLSEVNMFHFKNILFLFEVVFCLFAVVLCLFLVILCLAQVYLCFFCVKLFNLCGHFLCLKSFYVSEVSFCVFVMSLWVRFLSLCSCFMALWSRLSLFVVIVCLLG